MSGEYKSYDDFLDKMFGDVMSTGKASADLDGVKVTIDFTGEGEDGPTTT